MCTFAIDTRNLDTLYLPFTLQLVADRTRGDVWGEGVKGWRGIWWGG